MSDFSGRKISVGIGKETTRGTAVEPSLWVRHLDLDFLDKKEKIYNESAIGVLDKISGSEIIKEWAEGSIGGKVTDQAFGYILAGLFGKDPVSAQVGATGVYTHTFDQSNLNLGTSLTITRKDDNGNKAYPLGMLNKLEIEIVVGEWVKFNAEFITKKGETSTATVAFVDENEFKPKNAGVKMAANLAGIGAASNIPLKSLKMTFERSVEAYHALGSNDPDEIYAQEFDVKGDMVLRYTDNTYADLWSADTDQALVINVVNTGVNIGTGTDNPSLVFSLPRVSLSEWTIDQSLDKIVEQTLGFQGMFSFSESKTVSAVLKNTVEEY